MGGFRFAGSKMPGAWLSILTSFHSVNSERIVK